MMPVLLSPFFCLILSFFSLFTCCVPAVRYATTTERLNTFIFTLTIILTFTIYPFSITLCLSVSPHSYFMSLLPITLIFIVIAINSQAQHTLYHPSIDDFSPSLKHLLLILTLVGYGAGTHNTSLFTQHTHIHVISTEST